MSARQLRDEVLVADNGADAAPDKALTAPPAARRRAPGYVDRFRQRVLQDAIVEAVPAYWRRRATVFDQVGTPACDDIATACRRHANLVEQTGLAADVLVELVDELDRAA